MPGPLGVPLASVLGQDGYVPSLFNRSRNWSPFPAIIGVEIDPHERVFRAIIKFGLAKVPVDSLAVFARFASFGRLFLVVDLPCTAKKIVQQFVIGLLDFNNFHRQRKGHSCLFCSGKQFLKGRIVWGLEVNQRRTFGLFVSILFEQKRIAEQLNLVLR